MATEQKPMAVQWEVITRPVENDVVGEISHYSKGENLVTNTGRTALLSMAFVPSASAIGGWYWLAVGASSTAAQVTDTRLTYELVGNATRKALTNTNGAVPSVGDISLQTITIGGFTYYEYIVLQTTFLTTDGNNNNTFAEYGLFTTGVLPAGPTGSSGGMFNHYIDSNPAFKAATNQITVAITIRF
jgi:hypothetical protein